MNFLAYIFNNLSFDLLNSRSLPYGSLKFEYTLLRRIIVLLLYTDCEDGRTAAIARHVSFAQITCLHAACEWRRTLGNVRCPR